MQFIVRGGYLMERAANIQAFFHTESHTVTYLVSDPETHFAAIIDPVLDYDHFTGNIRTQSIDQILDAADEQALKIVWVLETHAHADHLSAAPYVKKLTGALIAIGEHIKEVQLLFKSQFNLDDVSGEGREFDRLLRDGDSFMLGHLTVEVLHTPGHTPACVSYRIGNAVFVGDTLFMPDYGTARTDFSGGSAQILYRSIQKLLELPPDTRLFMCHDYMAPERPYFAWETTVAKTRMDNIHVNQAISEDAFIQMRQQRDAGLAPPKLLIPAIQVNIRAGYFPEAESNGRQYLKVPLSF